MRQAAISDPGFFSAWPLQHPSLATRRCDAERGAAAEDAPAGRQLFATEWFPRDQPVGGARGDGLGPVYNEASCLACHCQGGPGGSGPRCRNVQIVTLDAQAAGAIQPEKLHPGFLSSRSIALHRYGTRPEYKSWRLRFIGDKWGADHVGAAGDPAAVWSLRFEASLLLTDKGRLENGTILTERNPPPLFGLGLVDAIADEVLLAQEKTRFERFRLIRGRARRNPDGSIGRFGWKAEISTLRESVLSACANELGLEVPGHHQASSPVAPGPGPAALDMSEDECNALVSYVRNLLPPKRNEDDLRPSERQIEAGRSVFESIGCGACHRARLGGVAGLYSDLLLHDMGALADPSIYLRTERAGPQGQVSPTEWRTPPLCGYAQSAPYLHDGRARDLEQAVAWHGGEATSVTIHFFELEQEERLKVQMFLRSLGPPEAQSR